MFVFVIGRLVVRKFNSLSHVSLNQLPYTCCTGKSFCPPRYAFSFPVLDHTSVYTSTTSRSI